MTVENLLTGPLRYLLTLLSLAVLAWLTLSPDPLPEQHIELWPGSDKMAHALMFGGFTVVFLSDTFRRRKLNIFIILFIIVLGMIAGAAIEVLQREMGLGRSADRNDFYADAIGVAAASGAWLMGRFSHK